jgi:transposase InsO family protein
LSSYPSYVRLTVAGWREAHPGWGAKTLRAQMDAHPNLTGVCLPSRASIGRWLQQQGLTRAYQRHSRLPTPLPLVVTQPHQVWELDGQGEMNVPSVGRVALLNLNDRASHLRLLSYPCLLGANRAERQVRGEDYQIALRLAFTDWGLPQRLQTDHGPALADPHSVSPFPTRLHLWLLALGVEPVFTRPARPTDQAMTERSHRLWSAHCLLGQHYPTWQALYGALRRHRDFLNHHLPCASLDNHPPLHMFPAARHSTRPYRPEWEADLLDVHRVYAYLALGRWFRRVAANGIFSLGGYPYLAGRAWAGQQIEITFDPSDQRLCCHDPAGQPFCRLPLQGVTVPDLMGQPLAALSLPCFQFALPFPGEPHQVLRLFEAFGV